MNYEEEMSKRISETFDKPILEKVAKTLLPALQLLDFITTVTEIKCDECNKIDKSYMDEWESAEYFLDEGWEIIGKKCLCKTCVEKKS